MLRDAGRPIIFVATGTGVAPCRSYLRTHPHLDLTLIHGVRQAEDLFYRDEFAGVTYVPCVSGEAGAGFHGRVTDYCRAQSFPALAHFYLCGANEMFYDMRDVLSKAGVGVERIFTEAYYYRADD
jgi:ferredoxin--NADP+ reductase/benzoate/toluate 1,2-dioxygenase reductase subunit